MTVSKRSSDDEMILRNLGAPGVDVTRAYAWGKPLTGLVTGTYAGHDWDILKDIIPAYLDHGVSPPYVA